MICDFFNFILLYLMLIRKLTHICINGIVSLIRRTTPGVLSVDLIISQYKKDTTRKRLVIFLAVNLYKCPFSTISISLDIMPSLDGEEKRWSRGELAGN